MTPDMNNQPQAAPPAQLGLIGQAQQQVQQPQAGLSDQDIAKLKQAKQAALGMIFDDRVFGEIVKRYDAGDKVNTLANTLVMIMDKTAEAVGGMSLAAMLALSIALIGEVAEVLNDSGREYNAKDTEQALYTAVQLWLKRNEGKVNPQELQAGMEALQASAGQQIPQEQPPAGQMPQPQPGA